MQGSMGSRGPQKLTDKGQATRARILRHAAELIYAKGVRATNNELLRNAAGVSGSQLTHYFPDKESLVLAVIDWQADSILGFHRSERFAGFDSVDAFQDWADFYILSGRPFEAGCSLGSLAGEIVKTDLDVHDQLARVFERARHLPRRTREAAGSAARRVGRPGSAAQCPALPGGCSSLKRGDIAPLRDCCRPPGPPEEVVQTQTTPTSLTRGTSRSSCSEQTRPITPRASLRERGR